MQSYYSVVGCIPSLCCASHPRDCCHNLEVVLQSLHLFHHLPHTPSQLATISLFSVSMSLFLFFLFWFLGSAYKWKHVVVFFSDLLHLAQYPLGSSASLQMARFHSFLWPGNIPLYIYVPFLYPFVLAIVNNAAVSTGVQMSFWVTVLDFSW